MLVAFVPMNRLKRNMNLQTVCFTGHREMPEATSAEYRTIVRDTQNAIVAAIERGATDFYDGGAQGYDLLCAELVLLLKTRYPQIRLHLVLPYAGSARGERYAKVLEGADEVIELFSRYHRGCMMIRDRRLVEEGELCIAYLRKQEGGTYYTVTTARQQEREVILV